MVDSHVAGEPPSSRDGPAPGPPTRVRRRICVTGLVQGVGFRPFIWRRATGLGLGGWVANTAAGVVIEVEGTPEAVAAFGDGLVAAAPSLASVTTIATEVRPVMSGPAAAGVARTAGEPFTILDAGATLGAAPGGTAGLVVPPDVAACGACLAEVADPANRRHRYPFTTCTACGPRTSIIESPPFERAATTMRRFAMCALCAAEYRDPADRRFHAQTNACPVCGPTCSFFPAGAASRAPVLRGDAALEAARDALRAGMIVAVKGVGGYRLACDATNATAVARLRAGKQRPAKPLAVLVADVAAAARLAVCAEPERRLLEGAERPIVLLARREPGQPPLAAAVTAGAPTVGVMLPDAPLHHLLCAGLPPLVMTSGNRADEPILHDDDEAVARLAALADAFLTHDRPIHAPADDSVLRWMAGDAVPVRRSRGAAPQVIRLEGDGPAVLAIGGDLKAAPCVTRGDAAVMGTFVGDLGSVASLAALDRAVEHLLHLTGVVPQAVAVDLHPGWLSTAWARRWAGRRGLPLVPVQHHEAHVAALVAERGGVAGLAGRACVGVCFDGTGYGPDGTIRGGEFFVVDAPGDAAGRPWPLRRVAALDAWPLPGGDAAAREPWRAALALVHAAGIPWESARAPLHAAGGRAAEVLRRLLDRGTGLPRVGSMGRLFDAVASLAGVRHVNRHEAEAAIDLEALARDESLAHEGPTAEALGPARSGGHDGTIPRGTAPAADGAGVYRFGIEPAAPGDGVVVVTWRTLVHAVVADVQAGVAPAVIAARFHAAVARLVATVCLRLPHARGMPVVGLTGGVFQNAVLTEATVAALRRAGFDTVLHRCVPPNDGGLALGQAVLARQRLGG